MAVKRTMSNAFIRTLLLSVFVSNSFGNEMLDTMLETIDKDCPIINHVNECPLHDEITYWLFTSNSMDNPYKMLLKNLRKAPYVNGPLKIWFHGYTDDHTSPIVTSVRQAYTSHGVNNVIVVDWGAYCKPGCYLQAKESIPTVGECVSKFLNVVIKLHRFPNIHLLGHSLGAHLAAWTSSFTKPKVDRLTKFDPAKPFFTSRSSKKGVAKFIDTYHSNAFLTGLRSPSGHVDVYFNTETFQPGCSCDLGCSHSRCVEYYLESINAAMRAFPCKGWIHYVKDKCRVPKQKDLAIVGEDIDIKRRGTYMAFTNDEAPYLKDHSVYVSPEIFRSFKELLVQEECRVMQYVSVVTDWVEGKLVNE